MYLLDFLLDTKILLVWYYCHWLQILCTGLEDPRRRTDFLLPQAACLAV